MLPISPEEAAGGPARDVVSGHGKTRPFRLGATFVPVAEPEAEPGAILGAEERYRVVRFLGQGGMGRVYEARRERDGRPVAVKVLRNDRISGSEGERVARFRQEAAAASRVGHPGIIEMLGFEQTPDGQVMLAMALLEGESFEDWMSSEGTLAQGLSYVAAFCDALHAAHEAGILHRDIKPENLFLHREHSGEVRPTILDFGLAKVDVPDHTQIETAAGTVLGTPYYLAPERALGKPLDRRADLYSVGVVLYELVTGVLPFESGAFMAILEGHVRRVPLDPRQAAPQRPIPASVSALVMALLEKDPARRPATAAGLATTLRGLLEEHAEVLASCPTGPRSGANPDADTLSMLALADGHTAAPVAPAGVSVADAATIAPLEVSVADAATIAPSAVSDVPTLAPSRGHGAAKRGRLGLFVGLGAATGAAGLALFVALQPASTDGAAATQPAAPAEPAQPGPTPEPPAAATPEPPVADEPVPARPAPVKPPVSKPAQPAEGGTNAATKKPRRRSSSPKRKPKATPGAPSLPAFKDDVYED